VSEGQCCIKNELRILGVGDGAKIYVAVKKGSNSEIRVKPEPPPSLRKNESDPLMGPLLKVS
jgi:hypothetical protein